MKEIRFRNVTSVSSWFDSMKSCNKAVGEKQGGGRSGSVKQEKAGENMKSECKRKKSNGANGCQCQRVSTYSDRMDVLVLDVAGSKLFTSELCLGEVIVVCALGVLCFTEVEMGLVHIHSHVSRTRCI